MTDHHNSGTEFQEREAAERALVTRARMHSCLLRLGELALSGLDVQRLSETVTQSVADALGVPLCEVLHFLPEQNHFVLQAGVGWQDGLIGRATFGAGEKSQAGYTLVHDGPVLVEDLRDEARFQCSEHRLDHGVMSGISTVIRGAKRAYGVLGADSQTARRFTSEEVDFVVAAANVLALALARGEAEDERLAAVSALARSQGDFRRVLESVPDAAAVLREQGIVYANTLAATGLGYSSPSLLLGKRVAELVPAEDAASASQRFVQALSTGRSLPPYEQRLVRSDGEIAWNELAAAMLHDFEGAPALLIFARDVTERRKMQEQLMVADRMASIGTLAAGIAHEMNNPLAAVIANLDLADRALSRRVKLDEELTELHEEVRDAREAAERVRHIVRDLKLFARVEHESKSHVDVQHVLASSLRMVWNEIRHRARLVTQYTQVPLVEANASRLGQVFLNVLINAAQAIPEGRADANTVRVATSTSASGGVIVEITDTGVGISPANMHRIFTPFFTTKPAGEGTGLGLSICQRIITELGGRLTLQSEPGTGTTVRVELPAAGGAPAQVAPPVRVSIPARRRGRILIVDDEPGITTSVLRLFSPDHDVIASQSADAALTRLRDGERFDIILCDLMMPQMTGMELHQELCTSLPDQAARMVFLTGGAFTSGARGFLEKVDNPRIDKPFDVPALRSLIKERIG